MLYWFFICREIVQNEIYQWKKLAMCLFHFCRFIGLKDLEICWIYFYHENACLVLFAWLISRESKNFSISSIQMRTRGHYLYITFVYNQAADFLSLLTTSRFHLIFLVWKICGKVPATFRTIVRNPVEFLQNFCTIKLDKTTVYYAGSNWPATLNLLTETSL